MAAGIARPRHRESRVTPPYAGSVRRPVAVVALLVVGLIGACGGSNGAPQGESEPRLVTTTNLVDGIEISLTAPASAVAGSRLWFDVAVRNTGTEPVFWQAGGCAIPVSSAIGPADRVSFTEPGDPARWNPEHTSLREWIRDHNALASSQRGQSSGGTGVRNLSCTLVSVMQDLGPGARLDYRGSVELRVPPGALEDDRYSLLVAFQPFTKPEDWGIDPQRRAVEVRGAVALTDDPRRGPNDASAAVEAFEDDPRLPRWLESQPVPGRPDLVQDYRVELSWWRDAWELWLSARWNADTDLRMRYDPSADRVTDVRTVHQGVAAADEPGSAEQPEVVRDEILPAE